MFAVMTVVCVTVLNANGFRRFGVLGFTIVKQAPVNALPGIGVNAADGLLQHRLLREQC